MRAAFSMGNLRRVATCLDWGALHFLAYQCGIEKTTKLCFMLLNYSGGSYIEASVCQRSEAFGQQSSL